jgi:hypothetical protein
VQCAKFCFLFFAFSDRLVAPGCGARLAGGNWLVAAGWWQLASGGRQVADLDVVFKDYQLRG